MAKIHIVEDDETLREELGNLLLLQGYDVSATSAFESLDDVLAGIVAESPDCLIVDLKLPSPDRSLSGHSICRAVRDGSDIPIIVLTSVTDEFDEVMAFNLGVDDYVNKPYRPAVLMARIQAALKSHPNASSGSRRLLEHAGVTLDLDASTVAYGGKSAVLSRNEHAMLSVLMRSAGSIVARQELMCALWESDQFVDDNTLTVNVNRLRSTLQAIGAPADYIKTRRGQGYLV